MKKNSFQDTFSSDLEFGNSYEMKLLEHIDYDEYFISKGNFKPYDIKILKDKKYIRYEVKADRLAYKTNNIAIEYECSEKPSGINTTRAKYYAYFIVKPNDLYDLYIVPVKNINELIKDEKYKKIVSGGYLFKSKMYLFDLNLFSKYIVSI